MQPGNRSDAFGFYVAPMRGAPACAAATVLANMPYLAGAQAETATLGLHLLTDCQLAPGRDNVIPRMVRERRVAGLILTGDIRAEQIAAFAVYVPHMVVLDRLPPSPTISSIVADRFGGVCTAVQRLWDQGCRRLSLVLARSSTNRSSDAELQRAWLCTLFDRGIIPPREWLIETDDPVTFAERLPEIRGMGEREAFLIADPRHTHELARRLWYGRLTLPEYRHVVGFSDAPDIELGPVSSAFSTIGVDKVRMGRLAIRSLCSQMGAAAENRDVPLEPKDGALLRVPCLQRF